MIRYCLYKIGKFLVLNFPQSFIYGLARLISDAHYFLHFVDRKNVKKNILRITKNPENVSVAAHQMFRNFGIYLIEFFQMKEVVNQSFIEKRVIIKNLKYMKEVLAQGKGGVVLTGHIGNWELGALLLSELGYPLSVIALPHKNEAVNNFFNEQRESRGNIKVIPTNISVRKCINQLRNNQLVAVVGDRDFFDHGEEVPFLGENVIMPKGPAAFSLKTGAPIIPMFFVRDGSGKYILEVFKPIYPPELPESESDKTEVIRSLINQYVPIIEETIKRYPSQWLMFRDFAKSTV